MDLPTKYVVVFGVSVVVFVAVCVFFWNRCPKCKARWATRKTGQRRDEDLFSFEAEYRCGICGHMEWRRIDRWWAGV